MCANVYIFIHMCADTYMCICMYMYINIKWWLPEDGGLGKETGKERLGKLDEYYIMVR